MSLPPPQKPENSNSRMLTLIGFLAIVALLYFGRDILIPIALAILISFLLSPVVLWIERQGLKRVFAVVLVVIIVIGMVTGIGYMLAGQFVEFVDNMPKYRKNIVSKIHSVKPGQTSVLKRAEAAFKDISREVETETTATVNFTTAPTAGGTTGTTVVKSVTTANRTSAPVPETTDLLNDISIPGVTTTWSADDATSNGIEATDLTPDAVSGTAADTGEAVPVRVVEGPTNTWQTFIGMAAPLLTVLGNAGLVILIVIFFLLEREDLRDRVLRLVGQNRVRLTTEALEEATSRVSRYLLMQLIINVTYGIPVAIGLWIIGVPNALLWGTMCIVLRFIPYVGPWLAASMPVALSLAVFDGWTMPLIVIAMFIVLELISNNLMEPILYGHSTGVSPVAIIVSAVFWTWLWGPVGLVLATPITVCLVVLGGYIPQLAFLRVLLGDEQVLDDDARIYNRLLSGATDEAVEVAEEYLEDHNLEELYDKVLVPALERAEIDRNDGLLSEDRYQKFASGIKELLESINDHLEEIAEKEKQEAVEEAKSRGEAGAVEGGVIEAGSPAPELPTRTIVCVPVNDESDQIAAQMLQRLVQSSECDIKVLTADNLVSEVISAVREADADSIILSSVPPFAVAHARYLAKRLRAEFPEKKLYGGLWVGENSVERADQRLRGAGVEKIFTRLHEAAKHL